MMKNALNLNCMNLHAATPLADLQALQRDMLQVVTWRLSTPSTELSTLAVHVCSPSSAVTRLRFLVSVAFVECAAGSKA